MLSSKGEPSAGGARKSQTFLRLPVICAVSKTQTDGAAPNNAAAQESLEVDNEGCIVDLARQCCYNLVHGIIILHLRAMSFARILASAMFRLALIIS